jgi:hypothetical protein
MMLLVGNGGGNGGGMVVAANIGSSLGVPDPVPVPMDGVLEEAGPGRQQEFRTFTGMEFPKSAWDPRLVAQVVLADFGTRNWQSIRVPPPNPDNLQAEIDALLEMRSLRPSRLPEIVAQAQNLEMYWANLLMVGPLGRPNTATLIAIGIAIGQMVGMYWKREHNRARPVQVFPALMPAIMTPAHASYPSNHSFQSHLIARALAAMFEGEVADAMHQQLFVMATRIAQNREIAGVHFPSDSEVGKRLAEGVFGILEEVNSFKEICAAAKREEWSGIGVGWRPQYVGADMTLVDQIADRVVERLQAVGYENQSRISN